MDAITIGLWALALMMGCIAFSRPGRVHVEGAKIGWGNILVMGPRITMAILVSGFFAVIVPTELVANWMGKESGMTGILIGFAAGGLTPGGPMLSFPIVAILLNSGAAVAPLITFLTSWSIFALHRFFAFEIPLMGTRFALIRILSSLILPLIAGILAMLWGDFGMTNPF
jgi:uncharacterized membrane protein YraQ (UPF0718 family)